MTAAEPVDQSMPQLHAGREATGATWLWRNGELVPWQDATIHVSSVGHASVAAVFEGIKAYRAADGDRLMVFRLDEHLRRLHQSARLCRLGLPYSVAELRAAVLELLAVNGYRDDTYIRPWVFAAGVIREQLVPADVACEVVIDTWPFVSQLLSPRGCRAAVSSWIRAGDSAMPPRAKAFSNYHNGRLAAMEAKVNGHDWPILLNDRHQVAEGPGACVVLVRDGRVVTPSLESGVLDSITRATALELLAEQGHPVEQRGVDRSELYLADEICFVGTGWEVLPVTSIDGLTVGDGDIGPVTAALEKTYASVVRAESNLHAEWLTPAPFSADVPSPTPPAL